MEDDAHLIKLFADEKRKDGLKESSIKAQTSILENMRRELGIPFAEVSKLDFTKWLHSKPLTDNSKRQYRDHISRFYRWGIDKKFFDYGDPTEGLVYGRPKSEPNEISDEEVAIVFDHKHVFDIPEIHLYLALIAYQGMRPIEVALLTTDQLNLKTKPFTLKVEPKSGNSSVLHPEVVKLLLARGPIRGRVFPTKKPHNISHDVSEHILACGVEGSAESLRWWHRRQVRLKGENFGRAFEACALDNLERQIVEVLEREVPSAAVCYRQALLDMNDDTRISFRGAANEMREALSETLHALAPDNEVMACDWFKLVKGQSKPTQAQKAGYIIRTRTNLNDSATH